MHVTTGAEIMSTSVGAVFSRYVVEPSLARPNRPKWMGRVAYWVWVVLGLIGVVAFIVGLISWATRTTFRTR
jgi:hypothetical protein